MASPSRTQPFTGLLHKRGKYNKDWKERWCVCADQKIYYYKSQNQLKAIAFIPLDRAHARVCKDPLVASEISNCFEIITYSRVYYMSAPSPKLMYDWIQNVLLATDLQRENSYFEQMEELIEMASVERSRLIIERNATRIASINNSQRVSKDFLSVSPENSSIPQSPFKNISASPPVNNRDALLQQHSAASTRLRFLGSLQIKPKAPSNGVNSTSPPPVERAPPVSSSLADFRNYTSHQNSFTASLPSSISQPEASSFGNSTPPLASLPSGSSILPQNYPYQQPQQPQLFRQIEKPRSNTFKDRTIGEDRTNSDPLARFAHKSPSTDGRKPVASSLDESGETPPQRRGSLIGGYRSLELVAPLTTKTPPPTTTTQTPQPRPQQQQTPQHHLLVAASMSSIPTTIKL